MPYEALPQPKFNDTSAYSTRAEQAASVDELVSSISAEMAGNATRDSSQTARPRANSLTRRPSARASPSHTSATAQEGQRATVINGKTADTLPVNGVGSRDFGMHTDKNILPGAVPNAAGTSSPPKAGNPVTSEKISQRSHEGTVHLSPSLRGNDHVAQSPSSGRLIEEHRPAMRQVSVNGTRRGNAPNGPKYLSNGHGSISHGAKVMSDKNPVPGGSDHQAPPPPPPHSHEIAIAGKVQGNDLLPAGSPGPAASQAAKAFTHQEPSQEPLGAHIVRVEALLRGALMELETLKRAMR